MFLYLKGMSESLSKIKDQLTAATDPLDHHLIKLMLFDNAPSREHWKAEVYSFLNKTYRAKGSNKFPKYSVIRSALAVDEDILDNYIKQVKSDYDELMSNDNTDSYIISKVVMYHDWLATKLSNDGMVTRSEVFEELKSLDIE